MAKLIAKTYGEALFETAVENKKTDILWEESKQIRTIFKENPELLKLLNHPNIVKEEKLQVVDRIFKGRVSDEMTGFLRIVVAKNRQGSFTEIFAYFDEKVRELKGVGVAYVDSAMELSHAQKEKVEQKLLATTGYRSFEIHYRVDESLLGGMVIRIGDRIADNSVKTRLDELTNELKKIQLA